MRLILKSLFFDFSQQDIICKSSGQQMYGYLWPSHYYHYFTRYNVKW